MIRNYRGGKYIKRKILADYVVDYLIDEFVEKKITPGDRVLEIKIAKEMDVSQTVVREAINILALMGFLDRKPFKGAFFRNFTIKDLFDYQEVQAKLEVMAFELATKKLDYKNIDLNYLKNTIDKMILYSKENNYKKRTYYDIQFHRHLVEASGNKSLVIAWDSLGPYYWAYAWLSLNLEKLLERTLAHQPIYESLKLKDSQKSIFLIKKHFEEVRNVLLKSKHLKIKKDNKF